MIIKVTADWTAHRIRTYDTEKPADAVRLMKFIEGVVTADQADNDYHMNTHLTIRSAVKKDA